MSPSQNQTRSKPLRRGPPRPTTARGPRAGLLLSLALHLGVIGGTYLTWSSMVAPTDITNAVPVDLVIAKETNVAPQAPPPDKLDIPKPDNSPPPEPQM